MTINFLQIFSWFDSSLTFSTEKHSIVWISIPTEGHLQSVQFSSVPRSCLTLCDPMNRSMPGHLVHHQLPESIQTHVHQAVMPSSHLILCRPLLLLPSIPPSIMVFSNESTLHEVAKVLEFRLQHQSFQ